MARQARMQYEDWYDIGGAAINTDSIEGAGMNDADSIDADKVRNI